MKTKNNKNGKEMGNDAGMHLKDTEPVVSLHCSEIGKRPDNAVVLGQIGGGMGFSVKVEQVKRALGKEREYDK